MSGYAVKRNATYALLHPALIRYFRYDAMCYATPVLRKCNALFCGAINCHTVLGCFRKTTEP